MAKITVLIVDDHPFVRDGLRLFLEQSATYRPVGEAETGAEALRLVKELGPELVLLDLGLPDRDGIEVCREITGANEGTRVLVLSGHVGVDAVVGAFRAGARGYLTKGAGPDELVKALDAVWAGHIHVDCDLSGEVLRELLAQGGSPAPVELASRDGLTRRELEVLSLVARDQSNKEIASALGISPKTVEHHRASLMRKLDAHSTLELVKAAVRLGLVDPALW